MFDPWKNKPLNMRMGKEKATPWLVPRISVLQNECSVTEPLEALPEMTGSQVRSVRMGVCSKTQTRPYRELSRVVPPLSLAR